MYDFNEIAGLKIQLAVPALTFFNTVLTLKTVVFIGKYDRSFHINLTYAMSISLGSLGLASSFLGNVSFKTPCR